MARDETSGGWAWYSGGAGHAYARTRVNTSECLHTRHALAISGRPTICPETRGSSRLVETSTLTPPSPLSAIFANVRASSWAVRVRSASLVQFTLFLFHVLSLWKQYLIRFSPYRLWRFVYFYIHDTLKSMVLLVLLLLARRFRYGLRVFPICICL